MRQIVIDVKDNKYPFFLELLKNLNFVSIRQTDDDREMEQDVKLYDKAKKRKQEFILAEEAFQKIESKRKA